MLRQHHCILTHSFTVLSLHQLIIDREGIRYGSNEKTVML